MTALVMAMQTSGLCSSWRTELFLGARGACGCSGPSREAFQLEGEDGSAARARRRWRRPAGVSPSRSATDAGAPPAVRRNSTIAALSTAPPTRDDDGPRRARRRVGAAASRRAPRRRRGRLRGHVALVPLEEHLVRPARAVLPERARPLVVQQLDRVLFSLIIPDIDRATRVVVVLEQT